MFYVTDTRNHHVIAKDRSVARLVEQLTRIYPQIGLVETSAQVELPKHLKLAYISR